MKITVSSPDGLGDFILRLPLLLALREAGHELQIVLRPPAYDLALMALPGCEVLKIASDPYANAVRARSFPFRLEHRAIAKFQPELFLVAAFNISFFDQVWVERHHGRIKLAGFTCLQGSRSCSTTCDPERVAAEFTLSVPVDPFLPDAQKNHVLLESLLRQSAVLQPPKLKAQEADLAAARVLLKHHGLTEGKFWIACIGNRPGITGKHWGESNWRAFFHEVCADKEVAFLGNTKECESINRIIENSSSLYRFVNMASNPPLLPVSLALAELSAGYVGRDSGIMHMAAALDKPLLALFSGAHGKRFWPSASCGVVVVQDWPCRECEFCCAHDGDHCVKAIPQETMRQSWDDLQAGSVRGLRIVEVAMPEGRALELAREASQKYARLVCEFAQWQAADRRTANWIDAAARRLRVMMRRKFL